jgi:two-component system sensor histidine kinase YesM
MGGEIMLFSLRNRLIITFALLLVLPFIIMIWFLADESNTVIEESIKSSTSQTMDQYTAFANTITKQIREVANQILGNTITQEWITLKRESDLPESKWVKINDEFRRYLSSVPLNNSNVVSIEVFFDEKSAIWTQGTSFQNSDWYSAYKRKGTPQWITMHRDLEQPLDSTRGENINSLLFPLTDLLYLQNVGVIKINFRTSLLQDPINKIRLGESGRAYLLNRQGQSVLGQEITDYPNIISEGISQLKASNAADGMLRIMDNKKAHMLFYSRLAVQDWFLVGETPEDELFSKISSTRKKMIQIGVLLFCLTIVVASWLSYSIAKPLSRLARAMKYMEKAEFQSAEKVMPTGYSIRSEVGFVITVFSTMMNRLKRHIEIEFEMNLRRRDAEYKALLLQINPHFLYNTLEVIGSMAALNQMGGVMDVTESLGKMLRFTLKLESDLVKLEEELNYIRHYVTILNVRYGERLQIQLENDTEADRIRIVKFILQPLIENSVKFSLGHSKMAEVKLSLKTADDILIIAITDNGVGMEPKLIDELITKERAISVQGILEGTNIGLRNVLSRCRLYYGDKFIVKIISEKGNGTAIFLEIPIYYGEYNRV